MLQKIVSTYCNRFQVHTLRTMEKPDPTSSLMITIPSFKEPDILTTLRSLGSCQPPSGTVEVIIVINAGADAGPEVLKMNALTVQQIQDWIRMEQPGFINTLIIREEEIPKKMAGAGMARKIGMDEAVQRWAMIEKDGPIICLDADCTVSANYLIEAEKAFSDPHTKVAHFQFEHAYDRLEDTVLRQGIIQYELHLRCYIEGLRQAGYPHAIHTVGSCMAVRAAAYAKAGGMNKRKAGEDFYFLHKVAPLGGWRYIQATVYPSSRVSDRVPFGTGRAQMDWVEQNQDFMTYSVKIYHELSILFHALSNGYKKDIEIHQFSKILQAYLNENFVSDRLKEIQNHSNSLDTFGKRLWQWMDGFMVLKLTHYLRDHGFPNQHLEAVSKELLVNQSITPGTSLPDLLQQFRTLDQ